MKKKVLLLAAFAVFGLSMQAQDAEAKMAEKILKVGINAQLPLGEKPTLTSFGLGLDVSYTMEVADGIDAGVATGFSNLFIKSAYTYFSGSVIQYIPLAAVGRYQVKEDFSVGADLGYALGISEDFGGGFYYKPTVEYRLYDKIQLNLSYVGVSSGNSPLATLNLGVLYSL